MNPDPAEANLLSEINATVAERHEDGEWGIHLPTCLVLIRAYVAGVTPSRHDLAEALSGHPEMFADGYKWALTEREQYLTSWSEIWSQTNDLLAFDRGARHYVRENTQEAL